MCCLFVQLFWDTLYFGVGLSMCQCASSSSSSSVCVCVHLQAGDGVCALSWAEPEEGSQVEAGLPGGQERTNAKQGLKKS